LRREATGEKPPEPQDATPVGQQVSLDQKAVKAETPAQKKKPADEKRKSKSDSKEPETHGEAIDKFITEFKKEVDKITGDTADQITVATIAADDSESPSPDDLNWEERLEKVSEDQIRLMSREIVHALAEQVAKQLVARVDPDVVYHLIKAPSMLAWSTKRKSPLLRPDSNADWRIRRPATYNNSTTEIVERKTPAWQAPTVGLHRTLGIP